MNNSPEQESQMPIEQLITQGKWSTVTAIRDANLQATDWLVVKSHELGQPLSDEFKAYRQALRDIPQTFEDPDKVIWPEKPSI